MKSIVRCPWAHKEFFHSYHDIEWGTPVHDDQKHFEMLVLETAQAGLSWEIILKKREGYRKAFAQFDPKKVAKFNEAKMSDLKNDAGIIRNRLKIAATVSNAQAFLKVQKEFGSFDKYIWSFTEGKTVVAHRKGLKDYPTTTTELSDRISKDLKKRGFKFVGSTVINAHLQAIGIVNDHTVDCFRYKELTAKY